MLPIPLRTVKNANLQLLHGQSWKRVAQLDEAATILAQNLGECLIKPSLMYSDERACCLCLPEDCLRQGKAPIPLVQASPLCSAELEPYYPTECDCENKKL